MDYAICGIQQIGIGNDNVYKTWEFYRKYLGMDLPIFDEAAIAGLMLPYTDGEARKRHAVLALNYQGGGGIEIWQYTERKPVLPKYDVKIGDLGIYCVKYKCKDALKTYQFYKDAGLKVLSSPQQSPDGVLHFFLQDLHGNLVEIVESTNWFANTGQLTGGVFGCSIGVSDMDKSLVFYSDILGYDHINYDETSTFGDLKDLNDGSVKMRRVLLTHSGKRKGPFAELLGSSQIELTQLIDTKANKIFEGRSWGDPGYIHLCFDVLYMDNLKKYAEEKGHPFTVDSAGSFDMGEAAGRFCYTEDPDGTLIEFVETHKIPIMKKYNWYLDLRNRTRTKALPAWMLWAMSLGRVKTSVLK